jgi:RNA polymerase sigma-70 factor (ECF subfamily)
MSDQEFSIVKLQAMDSSEWERLQAEYSARIYFFVRRHIGDHQTSEDLTQEVFLGAVRGMPGFKPEFTLEQFLFGIARNRIVDHFRKGKLTLISPVKDENSSGSYLGLEQFESGRRSPDQSALLKENTDRQKVVLADILKQYVSELWTAGEFEKLKVLEFLFALGGRNKEAADRFDVRDEKAVAGIKFRAIERLRGLARQRDPNHSLFFGLWQPGSR